MRYISRPDAILLLEDGTVFKGKAAGTVGTATGEICFNTGMTGYQEIFTDPSYFGQIMVTASVHIGNYGVSDMDVESDGMKISGLVCRYFSPTYSRYVASGSIVDYFEQQQVVGISDVDTRALVRHIRDKGAMNAIISSEELNVKVLREKLANVPSMEGLELSSKVCTKEAYTFGNTDASFRVAVLDLGVKKNILRCLADRDCHLKVFPMDATLDEMLQFDPDGFMLSNGPGDPSALPGVIATVKEILATGTPVFGICLGHQVLALSQGISTYKMHNGHRGINHPVKNLVTGKCEVTSQNHGFVVSREECLADPTIEITHEHVNDGTVAGIRLKGRPVFSVQYHPESSPGPNDSRYLFDAFVDSLKVGVVV
ncbi:MAG: glutamine-hydrolyzing carbamoyl-phosphate synthase small subunit [Flavobacteriales bacterium]|nr:glutamine-hydrolyzing carbamoyl-phosphate synthase small subunit [Flavobacteriales bacterium]